MIDDKIQHTKERTTNKKHNTKKFQKATQNFACVLV